MEDMGSNQSGARLGRILMLVLVVAALGVFVASLSSCNGDIGGLPAKAPAGDGTAIVRVRLTGRSARSAQIFTTGGYRLTISGQTVAQADTALPPTRVRRSGGTWQFGDRTFTGGQMALEPSPNGLVGLGRSRYRGNLHLVPTGAAAMVVVNHVDVESYLAGVMAKELYPNWHIEAYRALAVAARTFALYHVATISKSRAFDLGSGQGAQVYGGRLAETPRAWQAVQSTRGIVLAGGPSGNERIFLAQYSACCGGRVNPATVLYDAKDIRPLQGGQKCEDCRGCRYYRWGPVTVGKPEVYRAIVASHSSARRLGSLRDIRVTSATRFGRPVWLELIGTSGRPMRLRAESLRLALLRGRTSRSAKLRSMNCRIESRGDAIVFTDGRGFGHSVGLCQWGAQGKAEKGWSGEEILEFYYPGAKRFRAY